MPISAPPPSWASIKNKPNTVAGFGISDMASQSVNQANKLANDGGSAPSYACRAWVNFNGTGTVAIRASGNVSSITDNGVGDYTVNFSTAMSDANYAILGTMGGQNVQTIGGAIATPNVVLSTGALSAQTTSSCRIVCAYNGADAPYVNVAIFR